MLSSALISTPAAVTIKIRKKKKNTTEGEARRALISGQF